MTNEHGADFSQSNPGDAIDSEMGPPESTSASMSGSSSMGSSGSSTSQSGDKLKDAAGRVANRMSDTVGQEVDTRASAGFDRAGTMLDHVANAVERAGDELRPEEAPIADVARAAAGQIRSAAGYLRDADMGTILSNAEDFARRQPAIFLGGALAIGLMASRFLKASPSSTNGYRQGGDSSGRFSAGMSSGYRAYGGYGSTSGMSGMTSPRSSTGSAMRNSSSALGSTSASAWARGEGSSTATRTTSLEGSTGLGSSGTGSSSTGSTSSGTGLSGPSDAGGL